jgi:glycosyltransferase involved in cell wall biosynthesis
VALMRIAIDVSTWNNRRGFGRFTRELVGALLRRPGSHRFVLFADSAIEVPGDVQTIVVPQSRPVAEAAVAEGNRRPRDLLRFSAAVRRARPDVLFYPAVYSWFPCPLGLPNLLTLHDAIAEHFPDLVFPLARYRMMWNLKVRLARAQASRFLTVSNAAREEIVSYMGIARERIDLTTEGPKAQFRAIDSAAELERMRGEIGARFGLPPGARTVCYVGGFAPHKNLLGLLSAFEQVVERGPNDVHLLLVGDHASAGFHSNLAQLHQRLADQPALAARVHFTGFVDDALLAAIYATSLATVMPSFSEGFGLPIVESMACGTPVLAARVGSMPEIVGDTGRLFDPHDTDALARGLLDWCSSDRAALDALRRSSLARAAQFSWQRAAQLTLESLERCVAGQRR